LGSLETAEESRTPSDLRIREPRSFQSLRAFGFGDERRELLSKGAGDSFRNVDGRLASGRDALNLPSAAP